MIGAIFPPALREVASTGSLKTDRSGLRMKNIRMSSWQTQILFYQTSKGESSVRPKKILGSSDFLFAQKRVSFEI
jgi:hypothetical protein